MSASIEFDLAGLVAAIEADDPAAQAAHYAGDVVVEALDRDHGPGAPTLLEGVDAVRGLFDDVASRQLQHSVLRSVADGEHGAIEVRCLYPDGAQVRCLSAFDHADGRIVRETRTTTWDA